MSYPIEQRPANKNGWHTPAEAKAYYGRYAREGVTVHWWGDGSGADNHDNIVNYIAAQATQGVKSVNFVVSDNKITQMVDADNVAWCSQAGNPTTISIEFQPTLSAEGYRRGGWLISELEKRYGRKLTLYGHNHWAETSCPGSIDINRLRAEADKAQEGEEVITKDDIGLLRIAHTEIGGWPLQETHAGKYDQLFLNVYVGTPVKDLIWRQWNEHGDWRAARNAAFAAMAELTARPTQENFDKLKASLQTCQAEEAKAVAEVGQLKAQQSSDQQAGDTLLRRLGQFLKKYLP